MLPKAKLTKLLIAELAAVPTGAQEAQGTAILKRKDTAPTQIRKQSAMTTATQGHQHLLYCVDESQSGSTSYESSYVDGGSNDCYTGHCHPWIRNADGSITIGESLGHTHDVGALSASLAKSSTDDKTAAAAPAHEVNASKSTRLPAVPHGGVVAATPTEKSTMDKDQEIATLKKTLASVIALSSAEHAHYKTLTSDDQAAFLAKSAADRTLVVTEIAKRAEEADKVVYVSKSTGDVYKAKDDARLVEMAKRMDAQATEIKKAAIRKTALQLLGAKAPGDDETHDFIVEQLGGNEKAMECLKGLVASSKIGKTAPGFSGGDSAGGADGDGSEEAALAALEKGLVSFCKAQNIPVDKAWNTGLPAFTQTDEGKALKLAYDESIAG